MKLFKKVFNSIKDEILYVKNTTTSIIASYRSLDRRVQINSKFINKNLRENKIKSLAGDYKIPLVIDEPFSRYLQKFMHSYRNKDEPTININNLLILTGPEKYGKSWFLRHNLKTFKINEAPKRTLVIHFDIKSINSQNFMAFLNNFEENIIASIVERNQLEMNLNNRLLITL